ncbi:MAG: GxxExxY protein [Anaerolineae bacterium]|nr:GxxExxY protein [Anaerolineae bacterium]
MIYEELTHTIIGAYYEVYNRTSRTYPEYIYERALMEELRLRGLSSTQQDSYDIFYKERKVGEQRLDLFVIQQVVVENKVTDRLTRLHKAQCISYLKTVDKPVGVLFNFGSETPDFHRLYFNPDKKPEHVTQVKDKPSPDWLYPELAYTIIGGLYEVHSTWGAGFVHRIYANACYYELLLRGLTVQPNKRMEVTYKNVVIGKIAFGHLIVEDKLMVFPVAIRDVADIRLENLKAWMRQCRISLGILANFDDVSLKPVLVKV